MRITRAMWWIIVVAVSIATLWLDIETGPYVQFPIVFVIPVTLAAWHLGRWTGIGFAVGLVLARLCIVLGVESGHEPAWSAVVNAAIRLFVLVGLAVVTEVQRHRRELAERVRVLEGILPICSFCKKIRRDDGTWEQFEAFVTKHSEAHFSHGLCEACLREQYPDYAGRADRGQRSLG